MLCLRQIGKDILRFSVAFAKSSIYDIFHSEAFSEVQHGLGVKKGNNITFISLRRNSRISTITTHVCVEKWR